MSRVTSTAAEQVLDTMVTTQLLVQVVTLILMHHICFQRRGCRFQRLDVKAALAAHSAISGFGTLRL